jgi:hypothetical protein
MTCQRDWPTEADRSKPQETPNKLGDDAVVGSWTGELDFTFIWQSWYCLVLLANPSPISAHHRLPKNA